ncbi:hypothetical protein [[Clostridium] colinum]|uniref:hypothetical protein n=1 Tax=[Clostridium] colinum TaxID=36835 RepID=UPI0020256965|nr:hypothetical protein [[Clostridium] colinum]
MFDESFFCFNNIKVGDIIKILALIFILIGIIIILKYLFNNKPKQNINKDLLDIDKEDIEDNNKEKDSYMSEMFSNKGNLFLMIGLFLIFIIIIIYISLGGFFK